MRAIACQIGQFTVKLTHYRVKGHGNSLNSPSSAPGGGSAVPGVFTPHSEHLPTSWNDENSFFL